MTGNCMTNRPRDRWGAKYILGRSKHASTQVISTSSVSIMLPAAESEHKNISGVSCLRIKLSVKNHLFLSQSLSSDHLNPETNYSKLGSAKLMT